MIMAKVGGAEAYREEEGPTNAVLKQGGRSSRSKAQGERELAWIQSTVSARDLSAADLPRALRVVRSKLKQRCADLTELLSSTRPYRWAAVGNMMPPIDDASEDDYNSSLPAPSHQNPTHTNNRPFKKMWDWIHFCE